MQAGDVNMVNTQKKSSKKGKARGKSSVKRVKSYSIWSEMLYSKLLSI